MKIVLYSDDVNLLNHWQNALNKTKHTVIEELNDLETVVDTLIIINYEALNNRVFKVLKKLFENGNRVLLLHRVPDINVAKRVLQLGAMGYGNALMSPHFILSAIHTLRENMIWLAPDLTSQLIMDIPPQEEKNNIDELLSVLTKREKEVALLLRDALTYKEIADKLGISPRTVKAHAHAIYKKLDTHDRIGLALLLK